MMIDIFKHYRSSMFTRRKILGSMATLSVAPLCIAQAQGETALVFAAASLTEVLQDIAERAGLSSTLKFSFAASSTLARQIEQGAPAQLFISADEAWMDYAEQRQLIDKATRRVIASNRLALIASGAPNSNEPAQTAAAVRDAIAQMLQTKEARIATGDPAHVPVGKYAQAALQKLGLWLQVEPRLARADNVRSALLLVERGEAAGGIVYRSDALVSKQVRTVALFPADSHMPIRYPAALLPKANAAARRFYGALFAPAAQAALRSAGFQPV